MIALSEDASRHGWTTRSSAVQFSSQWLEVRRDQAVRPDGSAGEYDHVVVPGAVSVLALDDAGRVAVTRQWIYVHRSRQWRLPSGRIDAADADPEAAARRELVEETGLSAERLVALGTINCADSFSNLREHAFVATGLSQGSQSLDAGEADLEVHWLPFAQVLELVLAGELPHAGSSFAVLTAHVRGIVR
jgi:ADP-ribose pyrophosphatase